MKQKEYYPVYINYPDYTVKASIVSQNRKINIDRSITYFWYSSNKIQETMGGVDGKMLHGLYSSFYLNGNLKEKGIFKTGVKNGEWTTWYENGKIKEIITWKKGMRSKIALYYNDEGELASSAGYKNGKLNGYQLHYKNGVVLEKKKYKNGNEVIAKIKTKKEKEKDNDVSEKKTYFSEKYKIITAKIKSRITNLKTNKSKENKSEENKRNEEGKEKKKKNSPPETPNKTQQNKEALSLKKKGTLEKRTQTKNSHQ